METAAKNVGAWCDKHIANLRVALEELFVKHPEVLLHVCLYALVYFISYTLTGWTQNCGTTSFIDMTLLVPAVTFLQRLQSNQATFIDCAAMAWSWLTRPELMIPIMYLIGRLISSALPDMPKREDDLKSFCNFIAKHKVIKAVVGLAAAIHALQRGYTSKQIWMAGACPYDYTSWITNLW